MPHLAIDRIDGLLAFDRHCILAEVAILGTKYAGLPPDELNAARPRLLLVVARPRATLHSGRLPSGLAVCRASGERRGRGLDLPTKD